MADEPRDEGSTRAPARESRGVDVPASAREYYKAVALVGGRMFSIFDGRTEYVLFRERHNPRGLWVCPDPFSVVCHARQNLSRRSVLYDAPRAMIRLLGWNSDGSMPIPREPGPVKLAVSNVVPIAVLPYSASSPRVPEALSAATAYSIPSRDRSLFQRPRSAEMQVPPGLAFRLYGGGEPQSERMQAMTLELHEQVREAEERLNSVRSFRVDAVGAPTAWVQRALSAAHMRV